MKTITPKPKGTASKKSTSLITQRVDTTQLAINFNLTSSVKTQAELEAIPIQDRDALTGEVALLSKIVRHPNLLMSSRLELSVLERRIFFLILRELKIVQNTKQEDIKPFTEITFQIHHSQVTDGIVGSTFRKVIDQIQTRKIEWEDSKNNRVADVIFIRSIYANGTIQLLLNYKLFPLFLDLSRGYTDYEIDCALALSSEYAQILYPDFCRVLAFRSEWKLSMDELRRLLNIKPEQYKDFRDFKRRVVDMAVNQINALTDLTITYTILKSVRQAVGFIFTIERKAKVDVSNKVTGRSDRVSEDEINSKEQFRQELEKVLNYDFAKLVGKASQILITQYPSFTAQQRESILTLKDFLHAFIRADVYATTFSGIKDRQAYVAEAVFGYKKGQKRQKN